MTKKQYKDYNIKKNKFINMILDVLEFKLDYEEHEIIIIYYELQKKPLKYLVYYYHKLIENV